VIVPLIRTVWPAGGRHDGVLEVPTLGQLRLDELMPQRRGCGP